MTGRPGAPGPGGAEGQAAPLPRNRIPLVQRVDYLKRLCKDKSVLHLGCADWPYTAQRLDAGTLLHLELGDIASELWGFEFEDAGLDLLRERNVDNLHRADLENLDALDIARTFDVVLAGEIIEHLPNPGLFLRGVRRFLRPDSVLVITTINAYAGFRFFIYGLRGRGGIAEPVHPDHVAYYSWSTLRRLLAASRLEIRRVSFYDIGPEHRPTLPWYWNRVNDACVRLAPQLADGLVVECGLG